MSGKQARWAVERDAHQVLAIWLEVSDWLKKIGQPLWDPKEFSLDETVSLIRSREICVGMVEDRVVSCMRVSETDAVFWPEANLEPALYLHKIAVSRSSKSQGLVGSMLEWVAMQVTGQQYLRLDCEPRHALLHLYHAAGFTNYDPAPVHRGGYLVQRMQLRVA